MDRDKSIGKPKLGQILGIERLGEMLRQRRKARGMTLEHTSQETGVSTATLSRIERWEEVTATHSISSKPDTKTLSALCDWLGISLDSIVSGREKVEREPLTEEIPDVVEAHLRADRNLSIDDASALSELFRFAYKQYSERNKKSSG